MRLEHVVEPRDREEADVSVVIHGRFIAQPAIDRVGIDLRLAGKWVVLHDVLTHDVDCPASTSIG